MLRNANKNEEPDYLGYFKDTCAIYQKACRGIYNSACIGIQLGISQSLFRYLSNNCSDSGFCQGTLGVTTFIIAVVIIILVGLV